MEMEYDDEVIKSYELYGDTVYLVLRGHPRDFYGEPCYAYAITACKMYYLCRDGVFRDRAYVSDNSNFCAWYRDQEHFLECHYNIWDDFKLTGAL